MTEHKDDVMVEAWGAIHVKENPGHHVTQELLTYPECQTCGEKSPAWDLAFLPRAGYFVEIDRIVTERIPVLATDVENASKLGYFQLIDSLGGKPVEALDLRIFPVFGCEDCGAVNEEQQHNGPCDGTFRQDESYVI